MTTISRGLQLEPSSTQLHYKANLKSRLSLWIINRRFMDIFVNDFSEQNVYIRNNKCIIKLQNIQCSEFCYDKLFMTEPCS